MKRTRSFVAILCLLLLTPGAALAAEVTLAWDPSPSPDVAGYRIHYRLHGSTGFDGIGILQGSSPIDVGAQQSILLEGLTENVTYDFTVTSYDSGGVESSYSNVISWNQTTPDLFIPALLSPPDHAGDQPTSVVFAWSAPEDGRAVRYNLYYGTDPSLSGAIAARLPSESPSPATGGGSVPLLALIGLCGLLPLRSTARRSALLAFQCAVLLLLVSCGGETGLSASTPTAPPGGSAPPPAPEPAYTSVITDIAANSFEIYDFTPGTTYYWMIETVDGQNVTESAIRSFTVAAQ